MKAIAVCILVSIVAAHAALPAPVLVRTPSLDSAVIRSDRVGANFAYSTSEGHAYAAISPLPVTYASQIPLSYQFYPTFIGGGSYYPVFGGSIFGGSYPGIASTPVAPAPPPAAAAPAPVPGTPLDEDTVAVESA